MTPEEGWLDGLKARFAARLILERAAFLDLQVRPDRNELIDRAHRLAGIAGMMGAPAVGEAASRLEEAALEDRDCQAELAWLIAAIDAAMP